MATVRSFKAVRPNKSYAAEVAALPYDVMNEEEARLITENNPYSFLNIDRSEVNLPVGTDPHSLPVYEKAAETLNKFISDGIFIKEEKPCLYIYRLTMNGRSQTGVVACTSIDEYLNGTIKKHEFTRKDKEQDRTNHVDFCNANTGPIFLTYKDKEDVQSIIEQWTDKNTPIYDFVSSDEIKHTVWVIDNEETIEKVSSAFKNIKSLYIADGHHRAASAVAVGLKRREENKGFTGDEEFNFFLSVIFPENQLKIMDYNRVVSDLNNLTEEEFLEKLTKNFYIMPYKGNGSFSPEMPHQFGMFFNNRWYVITADPETIPEDTVGSLDVSILQNNLLSPILGIGDPRTDERIDFVGGIRGLYELEKKVMSGKARLAFSMYPTSMEELMSVADSGNVMPPKSTWFEPKLRSGLFIHELK